VEDHPQGAKEIKRSLESMGADVESCGTIAEAMSLVKRRPFDVGVIDQGLPDGLGINCIREIMRVRPFMGLVMYTVRDDVGLQHTCQSLGVTYLSKPASRLGLGEEVKSAAQKTETMGAVGPKRLLIAEDTLSVREILKRQLDKLQVEVDFVKDGQQALEVLKKQDYGLLFTDLHMPEIDGYEVISKIRMKEEGTERRMPVIVLTADVQMSKRQTYMEYGFDECLLKPVSMGQLRRLLYRWGMIDEEMLSPGEEPPPAYDPLPAIPTSKENKPAIDVASLAAQMGSSEEEAREMLGQFVNITEPLVQQVQQAWDNRDMYGLREAAHSLKGAARSACCSPLGEAAAELQDAATTGEASLPLVNKIWKRFTEVEQAVNKL
jgi:CheY-like chemotaxis protein